MRLPETDIVIQYAGQLISRAICAYRSTPTLNVQNVGSLPAPLCLLEHNRWFGITCDIHLYFSGADTPA